MAAERELTETNQNQLAERALLEARPDHKQQLRSILGLIVTRQHNVSAPVVTCMFSTVLHETAHAKGSSAMHSRSSLELPCIASLHLLYVGLGVGLSQDAPCLERREARTLQSSPHGRN